MTASEGLDGAEEEAAAPDRSPRRLAVVGISEPGPCGMRDHGRILSAELERDGISCAVHWLERTGTTLSGALAETRAWSRALPAQIEGADAVLLHYSWAACSYRGLPLLEPLLARALRRAALPVVAVMHELVFPFGRDGARGAAWALASRATLAEIAAASDALLVTTEDRRDWLAGRRWLPRRPVAFAPVFSNLPAADRSGGRDAADASPLLALFGFLYDGSADVVLRALRELRTGPAAPRLLLAGSPGPDSRAGRAWVASARELGVDGMLGFTGLLDPQALSDTLAAADLLLFADPPGPTSRKGTLAGSLASGTPVLALDGPATWGELSRSGAVRIVPRDGHALAAEIAAMLANSAAQAELGARGRRFARERDGRRTHRRRGARTAGAGPPAAQSGERGDRLAAWIRIPVPAGFAVGAEHGVEMIAARVPLGDRRAARLPHFAAAPGIVEQPPERLRQRPRVTGPHGEPGTAVLEPLRDPARVAADGRAAGGEALDTDQPERLRPQRRHRHDGGFCELAGQIRGREPAAEPDPLGDPQPSGEMAKALPLDAFAAEDDLGVEPAGGAQERRDALQLHEPPGEDDAPAVIPGGGGPSYGSSVGKYGTTRRRSSPAAFR